MPLLGAGEDRLRLAERFDLLRARRLPDVEVLEDEVAGLMRRGRLGREVREVVREEVHGLLVLADLDLGAVRALRRRGR